MWCMFIHLLTCYSKVQNIGSQINKYDSGKYHLAIVVTWVTDYI